MKKLLVLMIAMVTFGFSAQAQRKTLVAYFSATGNTEKVAKQLVEATGGTIYRIQPEVPYSSADLDWEDKASRSSVEMADAKSRPAIKSLPSNLAEYEVIYLGYPIWWDLAPRIINTFLDQAKLDGKTVIPFVTSGSSSINNSEKELKRAYPNIHWKSGRRLNGASQTEINQWVKK